MNELQLFTNTEFGPVRTLEENGIVLFCAKDVAGNLGYCELSIKCRARPYKLEHFETTITVLPAGSATVTLTNTRMSVVPTVTVSADMTLAFTIAGTVYTINLAAGSHIVPSLVLLEGDTEVEITGTGSITFTYRKGVL